MARDQKAVPKKRYESPKLLLYGDLADMTRSGGSKGQKDSTNPHSNSMT